MWRELDEGPDRLPEEWGGIIPSEVFLEEANRIVIEGKRQGLILRALGGVAVRLHSLGYIELAQRMGRLGEGQQEFTDLDFMSYGRYREPMKEFFESLGYSKRRATLSSAASERQIYFHPEGWFFVDVFYDKLLVANHPLDFRRRLELDSPTIPVSDLLLEKLQIVNMGGKDVKDVLVLLAAHDVAHATTSEAINGTYVAQLLARDWGFWYTVTTNLRGLTDSLPGVKGPTDEERTLIVARVEALLDSIEQAPKSLRWKVRALLGSRVRWYQPVETMDTVAGFGIWRLRDVNQAKKEI